LTVEGESIRQSIHDRVIERHGDPESLRVQGKHGEEVMGRHGKKDGEMREWGDI
jgi:hypothetical protein